MNMNLSELKQTLLDGRTKGLPGNVAPFPLADIHKKNWNVLNEDLPFPLLTLKKTALEHNLGLMQKYIKEWDISHCPHGKTTMSPQLFKQQLDHGAWGITAATINQVQTYRYYGVQRILQANQLIGKQNIRYIVEELNKDERFDFYTLVDSIPQIQHIVKYAKEYKLKRPINVLVELGITGHRTGCRSRSEIKSVAEEIDKYEGVLKLSGIEGFEGVIFGSVEETEQAVRRYLEELRACVDLLKPFFRGDDKFIISAGGTSYHDLVIQYLGQSNNKDSLRFVLRSGCYITHDSGFYDHHQCESLRRGWPGKFKPAFELFSYVQSIPEEGLAILTMGKRDCPYDCDLPYVTKAFRSGEGVFNLEAAEIFETNDQHAYMRFEKNLDLRVGDIIICGISHPCTAFDKWKFIPIIDDNYSVQNAVLTFF